MQVIQDDTWKQSESLEVLAQAAITAALTGQWQQAIKVNEKILSLDSTNVEGLNRLARAYACLGQTPKAEKTYKKVLQIDPYNIIALKNIEKLSKSNGATLSSVIAGNGSTNHINLAQMFLDEPGRTKLVNLLNLAPPSVLASLNCGESLVLNPKNHSISVTSQAGTYLGAFPDDVAHRLLSFITGGNKYEAYVRSNSVKTLTIFVRETQRSEKFGNQPTFQSKSSVFEDTSTR